MRPEPEAGVGTEVAEDLALGELAVDGGEVGTLTVTVPPRRSGSRRLRTSNPASSARSIRSWVCRSEFARIRSTPTSSIRS